ncbi:Rieske (2Fe-2S) protein [Pseudonocardia benzenivorans]|uniref:Rieske (2Fe-2S) protein n=1 Tax=Pseudonocardia benzenivorans TaxID=228005 RepID=A0ABW3VLA2_9PSEU
MTETLPDASPGTNRGTRVVVEKLADFAWGERRVVTVDGRSIGVINVGGTFYALRNSCPHHGAPLCEGVVKGTMDDTPAHEYSYVRHNEFIVCPWHGYEFTLATGRSIVEPEKLRVRTYEVAVEDGDVVVYV